ncbi:MHYT domain-containing protein [Tunturiibacter lichenicola]|jgi:NO-binding membrane sensor protein with MHYT domain|uniref:MHYT domain-containing protein n=1 Tax=Tunturiibacter lichenicola TaxID=2051959 RepID=UPI0021B4386A|nr:MHYT domain-containing protein [Edaphobacter lichenicola]
MNIQSSPLAGLDLRLVVLTGLVLIVATCAALALRERIKSARGVAWFAWLSGGASAMGVGNWAMHYLGLKALGLPVPTLNNSAVAVSIATTILTSGAALLIVSGKDDSGRHVKTKEATPSPDHVVTQISVMP